MRRTAEAQAQIDFQQKEAIMSAALEAFSTEGYGGTRVEKIAKKVHMSYGMVYRHYSTKEVLYHMTVQRAQTEANRFFYDCIRSSGTTEEKLYNYIKAVSEWTSTTVGSQSLMLLYQVLTARNIPEITRMQAREQQIVMMRDLLRFVKEFQQEGHLQDQPAEDILSMLLSMMVGNSFLRMSELTEPVDIHKVLSLL